MGKTWWELTPPVRDERATPVPEDLKQPKMVRHDPKPFSVQVRDSWSKEWKPHKRFQTLKRAEEWVKLMMVQLARRAQGAPLQIEYRVDPVHYPETTEEAKAETQAPDDLTLAQRAMFSLK